MLSDDGFKIGATLTHIPILFFDFWKANSCFWQKKALESIKLQDLIIIVDRN